MTIVKIDHVQLAIPEGGEPAARKFYSDLLGVPEATKPPELAARGGAWFVRGDLKIHLGIERDFRPAKKAHPALVVDDFAALVRTLRAAGHEVVSDAPIDGHERAFVDDPFGNRIELIAE
jgi:catechol 2,3-dioxygenase-like lactoylglutathione lyase family enzyme